MHCALSNALSRLDERLDDFEHISNILIGRPLSRRDQRLVQNYEDEKLKELENYCKDNRFTHNSHGRSGWELYDVIYKFKTDKLGMYLYDANHLYGIGYLNSRKFYINVIYSDRYHIHCKVDEKEKTSNDPDEMSSACRDVVQVRLWLDQTFPSRVDLPSRFADLSVK